MDDRNSALYDLLLRQGPMANQEIAALLGLSPATITHLIQALEQEGMLQELPAQAYPVEAHPHQDSQHRSRRKTTFRPNPAFAQALVADCSGSLIHFRRVAFDLREVEGDLAVIDTADPDQTVRSSLELVKRQLTQPAGQHIRAVGITQPWPTPDPTLGQVLPKRLADALAEHCCLPVRLIENARALALHDAFAGAGRRAEHFLTVYIHERLSLGLFVNGHLYDPAADGHPGLEAWVLPGGETAGDRLSRRSVNRQVEAMGGRVEHHETYRILQQALENPATRSEAAALCGRLGQDCARLLGNLAAALAPERIFLYSPLNELGSAFARPLAEGLGRTVERLGLGDGWKPALAAGAAKSAFDLWLSTKARSCAEPEGSIDPAARS
jgi:predicted NBD/HSP70 family sugar kinase/biotin operon repressor